MSNFQYVMPTKIVWGKDCLTGNASLISPFGKRAFIVTGKSSAKNGALDDALNALETLGITSSIYNEIEENPSIECVQGMAEVGRSEGCDFVVAIGGGSPLDAGKAAAVLLKNQSITAESLYEHGQLPSLPLVAVPTTAGTGSEVTHNFVLTLHKLRTKASAPQRVFPQIAFLDGKYMKNMPYKIMANTAIDALAHSIESYLSVAANFMSMKVAESAFESFGKLKSSIIDKSFDDDILNQLLLISSLGGIAISQTGTTIPHFLGYALTYNKKIPHGRACGVLLYEYMASFKNRHNVKTITDKLGFSGLEDFGQFLQDILYIDEEISANEISEYTTHALSRPEKFKNHPETMTPQMVENIYARSVEKFKEKNNAK